MRRQTLYMYHKKLRADSGNVSYENKVREERERKEEGR